MPLELYECRQLLEYYNDYLWGIIINEYEFNSKRNTIVKNYEVQLIENVEILCIIRRYINQHLVIYRS